VAAHHTRRKLAAMAVDEALARLRQGSPKAIDTLMGALDSADEQIQIRAADLILKRTVPKAVKMEIEATMKVTGAPASVIIARRLSAITDRLAADAADDQLPEPFEALKPPP